MGKPLAFYNENDPKAAAWLRELIKAELIAEGIVDERDIRDIRPDELRDYTQCHFFAGIGGWSLALRLAGWPDDRPVWTGSCPCQPFSAAGRGKGVADDRHLYPHFGHLVKVRRPPIVFGEQVASKAGRAWLDVVQTDMEANGYAFGAADIGAAGVGAPHWRQRLWFVAEALADANREGSQGRLGVSERADKQPIRAGSVGHGLADLQSPECELTRNTRTRGVSAGPEREKASEVAGRIDVNWLADSECESLGRRGLHRPSESYEAAGARASSEPVGNGAIRNNGRTGPLDGFWGNADWLHCRDGKWRSVEPGTFPLAHGVSGRVGQLRGYGNAIVPQVAQRFIEAFMEI